MSDRQTRPDQAFVQFPSTDAIVYVKNLGWLHRNLRYVESVRLTVCNCTLCWHARQNGLTAPHEFSLRASGRMPRGRKGQFEQFEYVTGFATLAVFNTLGRKRLAAYTTITDEVRVTA